MNHFKSLASLYNLGKYQQTFGFLMFSGEKKNISGLKWVNKYPRDTFSQVNKIYRLLFDISKAIQIN